MTRTHLFANDFEDPSMTDGIVAFADGECTMTIATWRVLSRVPGAAARLCDVILAQPSSTGTVAIPRSVFDPDAAEDLQRSLALLEPEPSLWCLYPPCGLASVTVRDGFPLCGTHDALLAGWDALTAS